MSKAKTSWIYAVIFGYSLIGTFEKQMSEPSELIIAVTDDSADPESALTAAQSPIQEKGLQTIWDHSQSLLQQVTVPWFSHWFYVSTK